MLNNSLLFLSLGEMVGTASCEETSKTGQILSKQPKLQQKFQRPQVEGYVVSGKSSPWALDASGKKSLVNSVNLYLI